MKLVHIGKRPAPRESWSDKPDWVQANPARIARSLEQALSRSAGGWFVLGASSGITTAPSRHQVLGQELVAYRGAHGPVVAPASCPHMGADLCSGSVRGGRIVCPWHGLSLGPEGHGTWKPFRAHDDGVLVWVQLECGEKFTDRPNNAPRPTEFIKGVIRVDATCETEDVIANRLDPWHGVHYHGHSFGALRVLEASDDAITLRVSYRTFGPMAVEVDATFRSPNPRTITMTIIDGEGVGSVVETHATPLSAFDADHPRTAVIEATLATSDRLGFRIARKTSALLQPVLGWSLEASIEERARRLWVEDAEYAERRYLVRNKSKEAPKKRLRQVR